MAHADMAEAIDDALIVKDAIGGDEVLQQFGLGEAGGDGGEVRRPRKTGPRPRRRWRGIRAGRAMPVRNIGTWAW